MKIEKIKCHPQTFGKVDKKYLDEKESIINRLKDESKFDGDISLNIILNILRKRAENSDLDNYLKAIIDAINESDIIESESQIDSINIKRVKVDLVDEEGVEIEIISV